MITQETLDRIAALPTEERERAMMDLLEQLPASSVEEQDAAIALLRDRFGPALDITEAELAVAVKHEPHDPSWGEKPSDAELAKAESFMAEIFAMSRAQQDRLVAGMLASPDTTRNSFGKDLQDALILRRLAGLA